MKKRDVLDIVCIIFGFYSFMSFLSVITFLVIAISSNQEYITKAPYLLWSLPHATVLFLLAYALIFKRHALVDRLMRLGPSSDGSEPNENYPCYGRLAFWIQILGLYYFISSASSALGQIAIVVSTYS